jgi:hypothetical protein
VIVLSRNVVKKLIILSIVIVGIVSLISHGYFSEAVKTVVVTKAKNVGSKYVTDIIGEEINTKEIKLFYEKVSNDGVIQASFDVNKANIILNDVRSKLDNLVETFNNDCDFKVDIPVNYLFIPSSYFLSNVTLDVDCSNIISYEAKLVSDIKEYGINSSLVSLVVAIDIKYQVVIPFIYSDIISYVEIPLALEIINGEVPDVLFKY